MRFFSQLREASDRAGDKHHVMAFGRLSPPTTGHEVLVNKVKAVAKEHKAEHSVILSHTHDSDKNPLSPADKLKHAKRFFPHTNLKTASKESPTFLHHAAEIHKSGATHLHMVAGSDRVDEYKKKLAQYNGKHSHALYNFKKIHVHSAGERDPDAEGTAGMSASKMRAHAKAGEYHHFKKGVPAHVSDEHAKEMYHDVRKGAGVHEETNLPVTKKFQRLHGNYCGKGNRGGEPTDALDAACKVHDTGYHHEPEKNKDHDKALIAAAHGISTNKSHPMALRAKAYAIKTFFKAKHAIGSHIGEEIEDTLDSHGLGMPSRASMPMSRDMMPQIKSTDVLEFVSFLRAHGIHSSKVTKRLSDLIPTQSEFSGSKVKSLINKTKLGNSDSAKKVIMISNDGYILDGHHRWLTLHNMGEHETKVVMFDVPILRLLAASKNFPKTFYKGVTEELLDEGLHDPGIFKAVFLAGGPGSGKDFILGKLISGFGLVEVSSDPFLAHLMTKRGLDLTMPKHQWAERDIVRGRAKNLEQEKKRLVIAGRLGIIVNGTADEVGKIVAKKAELEALGYDTMMVFVQVADEISRARNVERGERGGRTVPEHIRREKWTGSNHSMPKFRTIFGDANFIEVDNSLDLRKVSPDEKKQIDSDHLLMYRKIKAFIAKPFSHPHVKSWLAAEHAHIANRFRQTDIDTTKLEDLDEAWTAFDSERHTVATRTSNGGKSRAITKTSDTASSDHQYKNGPAKHVLKKLRQETADAFGYETDNAMALTTPAGTPAARGYPNVREDEKEEIKSKPLSQIVKEAKGYIKETNTIQNSDDLM